MTWDRAKLPWLPAAPADFRARCKAVDAQDGPCGGALQRLATHALSGNQLNRLATSLGRVANATPLAPFRLGLLSNATTSFIGPAVVASAARHGLAVELVEAPFGQEMQQALDPASLLNAAKPDAILLALDHRAYPFLALAETDQSPAALDHLDTIREGLAAHSGAAIIVQTLTEPSEALFGSLEPRVAGALGASVLAFNQHLAQHPRPGELSLDVAGLARSVGLDRWHDPAQWHLAKLPFAQEMLPLYAEHVARLLGALRGKSKKCLVLDLDNTCWGGVIGDDGMEGVELGQGSAAGEAFAAVQKLALTLRDRGVVLAVCSKNEEEIARQPFQEHPEMALKEAHIAVFMANWQDKASNLEAIAKALNIGVDALVLLDDNPAERAQVRGVLPMVGVPELPRDPALYPRALLAGGYFEAAAFTGDDRMRAEQYQSNAKRAQLQGSVRDLDAYLRSLEMVVHFAPFDAVGRPRITQLINKTNQFNLTTRRYTEAEVTAMEADSSCFTLQVRLRDTFGDNGMISEVVCRTIDPTTWDIDVWLMSCRVLGRGVEKVTLNEVVKHARAAGVATLRGCYIPTAKNKLVAAHYPNLGFSLVDEVEETTRWELALDSYAPHAAPIVIEDGFDSPRSSGAER